MIGIDTNVIIRYIVQDDPEQAKVATKLIEQSCSLDNPGYINHIILFYTSKYVYKVMKTLVV